MSPERKFSICNQDVNKAFTLRGDWSNSALLLPELVDDGVRLLVYAGNAGVFCSRLFWDCILYPSRCLNDVDYVLRHRWQPDWVAMNSRSLSASGV